MCDGLEIDYTFDGTTRATSMTSTMAWDIIWSLLVREDRTQGAFQVDEHSMKGSDVDAHLRNTESPYSFCISWHGCEADLVSLGNHDVCVLRVKFDQPRAMQLWEPWVDQLTQSSGFISARLFDTEYELWQNARDPLQYEAAGRSYEGLPMKSNELPPPLDRQVIDTTHNPGRRELRNGYIEAIGAAMWISPIFVERTGVDLVAIDQLDGVDVAHGSSGIVKLTAGDRCFSQPDGKEAALQDALRQGLYFS